MKEYIIRELSMHLVNESSKFLQRKVKKGEIDDINEDQLDVILCTSLDLIYFSIIFKEIGLDRIGFERNLKLINENITKCFDHFEREKNRI